MAQALLSDSYDLGRQPSESQRLDIQGRIWSTNIGYHIHPTIKSSLPSDANIGDIGCGTGAYLVSLSTRLPSTTRLTGFDSSSALFPSPCHLPPNVALHVADAKSPFPAHLHGTFDFIHLRLLVAGMAQRDWAVVCANVFALLKPGGFVQWEEADLSGTKRLRSKPGKGAARLDYMLQTMEDGLVQSFSWGFDLLPEAMTGVGFEGVEQDIVASDAVVETREEFAKMNVVAAMNWARFMAEKGQEVWCEEVLWALLNDVEAEIAEGAYVRYEIYVTIGKKPEITGKK